MLGTLRFTLASLVVLNHLWLPTANQFGAHAVAGFYIVSGFLMTKIIQEIYGANRIGTYAFLLNRALRIFPGYWFFLAATLMCLAIFPSTFGRTYSTMQIPTTLDEIFRNITLIYLTWSPTIVVPPSWSVSVEWFFYFAMIAGLSRSKLAAVPWLAISVSIHLYLLVSGADPGERYSPVYGASLFFATGAVIYFNIESLRRRLVLSPTVTIGIAALFCVWPLIVDDQRLTIGYYGAAALFIPVFVTCLEVRPARWKVADKWLGDLAYFVFITRFFAAGCVLTDLSTIAYGGTAFLVLSYVTSIALSLGFLVAVQRRIDR